MLSDARLAEIRSTDYSADAIVALFLVIEVLRAENAALREAGRALVGLVVTVSDSKDTGYYYYCLGCDEDGRPGKSAASIKHAPGCPIPAFETALEASDAD